EDGITIYHGDCRDVDAWLTGNVLITDPPYGIEYKSNQGGRLLQGVEGDTDVALRDEVLALWGDRPALVFGTRKRAMPVGTRMTLIWDKGLGVGMGALDLPWKPNHEEIYVMGKGFHGHRGSGVIRSNGPNGYAQI